MKLSQKMLRRGHGSGGTFNRLQLSILGVPKYPKKGWKKELVGKEISYTDFRRFLDLRGDKSPAIPDLAPE